jgi:hypothetical protein
MSDRTVVYESGYGITAFLAAILSWGLNHSVGFALLHFFCGFFYLVWAALARTSEVEALITQTFGG